MYLQENKQESCQREWESLEKIQLEAEQQKLRQTSEMTASKHQQPCITLSLTHCHMTHTDTHTTPQLTHMHCHMTKGMFKDQ